MIVDKRIVESVLKAVPTKDKIINRSGALKITEGGWLLALSGDATTGFAVRITVDKENVNMAFDARAEIEPGYYSRDALARWVHPMGGKTPEPLTEDEKKFSYPGVVALEIHTSETSTPALLDSYALMELRDLITEAIERINNK